MIKIELVLFIEHVYVHIPTDVAVVDFVSGGHTIFKNIIRINIIRLIQLLRTPRETAQGSVPFDN